MIPGMTNLPAPSTIFAPAGAITFGDIRDAKSAVSRAREVDRNYALLAEVGTRPRTRFLGKVRNPNPEMVG